VRRHALLSLSVPLAAVGCLIGHAAGYALVGMSRRDAHIHGYLSLAPQFIAICAAVLVSALTLRLSGGLVLVELGQDYETKQSRIVIRSRAEANPVWCAVRLIRSV